VAAVAGGVDTGAAASGMVRPALASGDGAIGSRRREHTRGNDKRGRGGAVALMRAGGEK
jgi:hypothetical protein